MLSRVQPLSLELLNRTTQAWIEMEYNRSRHEEIKQAPLERFLEGPEVSRPSPESNQIRFAFTDKVSRTQRRSDGTIQLKAKRFEVPSHLRHLRKLIVRYQTWDLSMAYLVDERTGNMIARIYPQDKTKNAHGYRRALTGLSEQTIEPTSKDSNPIPPLLRKLMADYAATGLPPAYLPKEEIQSEEDNNE